MSKRDYGGGTITQRGDDAWRLRYRVGAQRYSVTVKGSKAAAVRRLRELLKTADNGGHVAPDKMTVESWIDKWIGAGAPGKRKKKVGGRTLEDYAQKLRTHVKPIVDGFALQKLTSTGVGKMYAGFERKMSPTTARTTHVVFESCLQAAVRQAPASQSGRGRRRCADPRNVRSRRAR